MGLGVNLNNHLAQALRIRAFEKAIIEQFGTGQIRGTFHTSNGQELTGVILASLLQDQDYIFGNHRSHAMYLALTENYEGLASEVLGREGGSSAGIGGSQHLRHKNFYSNGIQGGMCAIAVGAAVNTNHISVCLIGDGTLGEGAVYESLNLASVLKTRTLFILEDNEIAQSTISTFQRGGIISDRFKAFGIPYVFVDSADAADLYSAMDACIRQVRTGNGPSALHIKSYRLGAHSKGDDNRSGESVKADAQLEALSVALVRDIELQKFFEDCHTEFSNLVESVKLKPLASKTCIDFAELLIHSQVEFLSTSECQSEKLRETVYLGLKDLFSDQDQLLMIGEDIEYLSDGTSKPYPGAFGVTKDLSELFPGRIINSPISESAITGFGIGRALSGKPTIVEIMFGDFTTLIVDAVTQQASKIVSMYGQKVNLPLMVRTPMGGRRGYGPTHSQNLESLFIGTPNLIIYSQNIFSKSEHYGELLELGLPVLVIEHKDLYSLNPKDYSTDFFEVTYTKNSNLVFNSRYKKTKVTVLTYGFATNLALEASKKLIQEFEIFTNIIVPQIISPLNLEFAKELLRDSHTLYLVEESDGSSGLAGLLLTELQRLQIQLEVKLISGKGLIGASEISEKAALLSAEKIVSYISQRDEGK